MRYFAFLRAINIGGRRLSNEALLEPFLRAGFDDVGAYQAAGNITFRTADPVAASAATLEPALAEAYGFDAPVFVLRADGLRTVADACPFTAEELTATEGRVQLTFRLTPRRPDPRRSARSRVEPAIRCADRRTGAQPGCGRPRPSSARPRR